MNDTLRQWFLNPTVVKFIVVLVVILGAIVIVRILQRSLHRYIRDSEVRYKTRKFIGFTGYFLVFMSITVVFSDRLGGLTVALGVAGAGVAFALQEVIASVAGWIAISFANFYKTGDRIQLGGIRGDVIDIGVLRTTLMECGQWVNADQYNGRIVRIANSFVFKEPVFNYSGDFPFLWDEIPVPIKYGCDHRLARQLLESIAEEVVGGYAASARRGWEEIVAKYRIEDAKTEPMVTLIANDNWIEFTLRYVVDYKKRRTTKDQLFTRILDEVEKTNGRVALASATFHLVEAPVIDVRLSDRGKESKS